MGFRGKIFKRFKKRRGVPSDASIDNTTIATKEILPNTPTSEKYAPVSVEPSPVRLPTLGLDPDGKTADEANVIPSTPRVPKQPSTANNSSADASPDHTDSTRYSSDRSQEPDQLAEDEARQDVPSMADVEESEKNVFTEITDMAFRMVSGNPDTADENVSTKSVESDNVTKIEEPHDMTSKVSIAPKVSTPDVELQRASSALEYTSAPVDVDVTSRAESRGSRDSSTRSMNEEVQPNETKVSQLEGVFSSGENDKLPNDRYGNLEEVKMVKIEESEELSGENNQSQITHDDQVKSNSSWIKDIEKEIVGKTPSAEDTGKKQVSFDEQSHHVEDDYYRSYGAHDDTEDDSSYDSVDYNSDFDDIDDATNMSADSMILTESDGIWGWLCGYDDLNISPGSIEDQEDKSLGTYVTVEDERSVEAYTAGSPLEEGEEMMYNSAELKPTRTLSSINMGRKSRGVSPRPRLPSLLKKREPKEQAFEEQAAEKKETKKQDQLRGIKDAEQNQTIKNQPNGKKGKTSKSPLPFSLSSKQQVKKMDDPPEELTATSKNEQLEPGKESSKEPKQLEIYCKSHGGAEKLVLRKYPSTPLPAGENHVLVRVEASTVSSRDCLLRLQGDPSKAPSPSVPGFQIVGSVQALGDGLVSNGAIQVGDRVAALMKGGGNARFISIPVSDAILLPPTATHENTVCLVSNYMTAYQALKMAKMKKGGAPLTNSNVLITGGSGPIGQALIDLASREGAVIHTTAHQMHQEHLTKNLNAEWYPVNPSKWLPELEGQMDVVIDSLCVDGYESSYKALSEDGVLICTGNISAAMSNHKPESMFESKKLSLWWSDMKARHMWSQCFFYDIYESYASDPKIFHQELLYLYLQMENGGISPKVAGRVSLNQVPKAQRLIEKGLPNGTVVLNPWKKLDPKQNVPIEKWGMNGKQNRTH